MIADLDGNKIGAMHGSAAAPSIVTYDRSTEAISKWQKDVASNLQGGMDHHPQSMSPRVIVNNFNTTPGVTVHRIRPESKHDNEISTKAIIGTLIGASAGAAVAYAMAKGESDKPRSPASQPSNLHRVGDPSRRVTEIVYGTTGPPSRHAGPIQMIDYEAKPSSHHGRSAVSRVKTLPSATSKGSAGSSRADCRTIVQTNSTKILACDTINDHHSSRYRKTSVIGSSAGKSAKPSTLARHSDHRSAKDIPLPQSRVSTNLTPASNRMDSIPDCATVLPDDSISQVSTKRSSNPHYKSDHHRHHRHSHSGQTSKHNRKSSYDSGRTIHARR